jgi:hypothetical protein
MLNMHARSAAGIHLEANGASATYARGGSIRPTTEEKFGVGSEIEAKPLIRIASRKII